MFSLLAIRSNRKEAVYDPDYLQFLAGSTTNTIPAPEPKIQLYGGKQREQMGSFQINYCSDETTLHQSEHSELEQLNMFTSLNETTSLSFRRWKTPSSHSALRCGGEIFTS